MDLPSPTHPVPDCPALCIAWLMFYSFTLEYLFSSTDHARHAGNTHHLKILHSTSVHIIQCSSEFILKGAFILQKNCQLAYTFTAHFITVRQRRYRKVMFSVVSVCHFVHRGGPVQLPLQRAPAPSPPNMCKPVHLGPCFQACSL